MGSVPPTIFPTLQMGRKSGLQSFPPSVRWKSESVPPTLFSHCNKMEKKSVPPTLFFPIIEGEKVQRVGNYPYPFLTPFPMRFHQFQTGTRSEIYCPSQTFLVSDCSLFCFMFHLSFFCRFSFRYACVLK